MFDRLRKAFASYSTARLMERSMNMEDETRKHFRGIRILITLALLAACMSFAFSYVLFKEVNIPLERIRTHELNLLEGKVDYLMSSRPGWAPGRGVAVRIARDERRGGADLRRSSGAGAEGHGGDEGASPDASAAKVGPTGESIPFSYSLFTSSPPERARGRGAIYESDFASVRKECHRRGSGFLDGIQGAQAH